MNSYLAMGLFALYVVAVTLVRCLAEDEFFRLTAMKRRWGRSRGLLMHFLANVALPMVLGIVFLTRGIADPQLPEGPSLLAVSFRLASVILAPAGTFDPLMGEVAGLPALRGDADFFHLFNWLYHLP